MKTIFFICATLLSMTLSAQLQKTFVDPIDGQNYPICKIDRQVFMSRNLATKVFRNGDSLLQVTTNKDWFEAQKITCLLGAISTTIAQPLKNMDYCIIGLP